MTGKEKWEQTGIMLKSKPTDKGNKDLDSFSVEDLTEQKTVLDGWLERQLNKSPEERSQQYNLFLKRHQRICELLEEKKP